jgi:hypothetical protein
VPKESDDQAVSLPQEEEEEEEEEEEGDTVIDLATDMLRQLVVDSAPPLLPVDLQVLLLLAREADTLWRPSLLAPTSAAASSFSLNTSTSPSNAGSPRGR